MLRTAHPSHKSLYTHPKPTVRHSAELAQIEIPLERLARQLMLFQPLQQQIQFVDALPSADDLSVSLGRNDVHTERHFGTVRVRSKIERLHLRRIAIHQQRPVEIFSQNGFIGSAEVTAPLNLAALGL